MGRHNPRCKECKCNLYCMPKKSFGEAKIEYSLKLPARLKSLKGKWGYETLALIYQELGDFRGYREFVKVDNLPAVDYFLPKQGIIVEFDELQHFTRPRLITLSSYPDGLKLGFDRNKWIKLAIQLNKRDNDPPFRDEQRAWYDTLRDFAPMILGYKPTVRLFASEQVWCQLNPDQPSVLENFQSRYFNQFL